MNFSINPVNCVILVLLFGISLAQKKDFTTSKCNGQKGNEFIAKVDACALLARQDFFSNILDGNFNKATCDLVTKRLECWFNTDQSYDCLSQAEAANVKNNILLEDIQRAQNESDFLGETYIASCGVLTNFRKDYVCEEFGCDSSCSFNEIQNSLQVKKSCEAGVRKQGKFLESFANSVEAWTRIFCFEYTQTRKCQDTILRCKNQEKRAITENINQNLYNKDEADIKAINAFKDFSYRDCQRSSGRARRHALMNDLSLSSEQQQAIKKIFAKRSIIMD